MSKKRKKLEKKQKKKKDKKRKRSKEEEATAAVIAKSEQQHHHQQLPASSATNNTVRVSLDTNIAAVAAASQKTRQNENQENSGGWSWDTVFAAAATIEPIELDQEFLNRTAPPSVNPNDEGGGGLVQISRLAAVAVQQQGHDADTANVVPTKHPLLDLPDERNNDANKKLKKGKRKRSDGGAAVSNNSQSKQYEKEASFRRGQKQETEEVSLEGRMVPHPKRDGEQKIMVLVDTKQSAVYSAYKRTSNDDLIRIGTLVEGEVILDDGALSDNEEEPTKGAQATSASDKDDVKNTPSSKATTTTTPLFPFPTDPDDHCETPVESYQDILPLLNKLCETTSKSKDTLAIYDPFFCDGGVSRHLSNLGFGNVHNKKQDCYKVWSTGVGYPNFDVLITNPPYSEDHIPKLMQHVTHANYGDRPWFLLMPNWVHKKDYYKKALDKANCRPFYLVPKKRYVYLPPKQFRDKKASDVHKKSSPFVSMWYVWGGSTAMTDKLIDHYYRAFGTNNDHPCDLARSRSALRDLRRKGKK